MTPLSRIQGLAVSLPKRASSQLGTAWLNALFLPLLRIDRHHHGAILAHDFNARVPDVRQRLCHVEREHQAREGIGHHQLRRACVAEEVKAMASRPFLQVMNGSASKSTSTDKKRSFNIYTVKKVEGGWHFQSEENEWESGKKAFRKALRRDQFFPTSPFSRRVAPRPPTEHPAT